MKTPSFLLTSLAVSACSALAAAQVQPRVEPPHAAPAPDVWTTPDSVAPSAAATRTATTNATSDGANHDVRTLPTSAVKGLDFSVVRYQDGADGALWARGRTYKARFDAESATVIPYFSPRAPRNFDLRFELESVSAGSAELAFAPQGAVSRRDDTVTIDRGAVDEQYLLATEQLEQRFVLESLPGVGDLKLRLQVTSELKGSTGGDGFRFANEWGHVHYGRATAIDARGETLALESTLVGDRIEIVVPERFAARAALPLTIDPVLSIFGVDVSNTTAFSADTSYDLSGGGVLHVYNVVFSANDYDVGSYATDRFGNVWGGSFLWTDFTGAHWVRPRVAHNGATDKFLIAAQVGQPGFRKIWGQVRKIYDSVAPPAPSMIGGPEIGEQTNVDVGGDPYGFLPSYFCIVYQRNTSATEGDIHARLIDTAGVSSNTIGTLLIDNSGGTLDAFPAISKSNNTATWNIVWQRDQSGIPTKIRGARVSWSGAAVATSFQITNVSQPERRPSVSSSISGVDNYMVACERDFTSDNDIQLYALTGTTVSTSYNLSGANGAYLFNDQRDPSIDSDGAHFLIGFREFVGNVPGVGWAGWDVYASEAQWISSGISVRQHRMALATTSSDEGEPQVASAESSNPAQALADYTVIYNRGIEPSTAGPTDDVFAALVVGSYGGVIANFCTRNEVTCQCNFGPGVGGCANSSFASGAHMAAVNASSTTNDQLRFDISGLKPNATALVFQGTSTLNFGFGFSLGDGVRCVGGTTIRFAPASASAAGALSFPPPGQLPISWQGSVPTMGGFYYYQTWYRDTGNFCSAEVTNLSDALMVEWTP